MPLFYSHNINATTRLGIWHITEPESFFLEKVPVSRNITHPHKRLQHLAARYLLQYLFPGFPMQLIRVADTRRPYVEDESHHFSISHCGDHAAAIVSTDHRPGIDIEIPTERVKGIMNKFLTPEETATLQHALPFDEVTRLTLAWSVKESMFKWFGEGELDFREHMCIQDVDPQQQIIATRFQKDRMIPADVHYRMFNGLVLSWMLTAH